MQGRCNRAIPMGSPHKSPRTMLTLGLVSALFLSDMAGAQTRTPQRARVAVVQYDPVHPVTGERLSDYLGWNDAAQVLIKVHGHNRAFRHQDPQGAWNDVHIFS